MRTMFAGVNPNDHSVFMLFTRFNNNVQLVTFTFKALTPDLEKQ